MTSHPSHRPVSALRERMIEDMTVSGFNEKTRSDYVRNVRMFVTFIGRSPDAATVEDLRRVQLHPPQAGLGRVRGRVVVEWERFHRSPLSGRRRRALAGAALLAVEPGAQLVEHLFRKAP